MQQTDDPQIPDEIRPDASRKRSEEWKWEDEVIRDCEPNSVGQLVLERLRSALGWLRAHPVLVPVAATALVVFVVGTPYLLNLVRPQGVGVDGQAGGVPARDGHSGEAVPTAVPPAPPPDLPVPVAVNAVESVGEVADGLDAKEIFYEGTDYEVPKSEWDALRAIARWLEKNPKAGIVIEGYADDKEGTTVDKRQALALKRAEAVKRFLVLRLKSKDDSRFTASRGEEKPLTKGGDGDAGARNRRVRIVVVPEAQGGVTPTLRP